MTSSSDDSTSSLPSNETETLPSLISDKSYANTCRILDYLKGLSDQLGKLGGEVTQLATFGTELRTSAHVANMTTGAVQSWQSEMSGYFDPKLIFTLANNALEDKNTRNNLMKLGVDKKTLQTHDVDKISQAIIRKLPEYYKKNQNDALSKFHSLGFDTYGLYRDIARGLSNLPKDELNQVISSLNKSEHRLNINDIDLQHAQEVKRTITRTYDLINTEKLKNGHKGLSQAEVYFRKTTEKIDNEILNFDQATSSSGGVGYALFDITSRAIIPILNTLKDAVCNAPKNKTEDNSNDPSNEKKTISLTNQYPS